MIKQGFGAKPPCFIARVAVKIALGWMLLLPSIFHECLAQNSNEDRKLVVDDIQCRGNVLTSCEFIRRKIRISLNSEIESDAVESAQLKLSALPNFQSVRIYLEKGSAQGKAILVVEVVEASPLVTELVAGVEHASVHAPRPYVDPPNQLVEIVSGRISDQNLFGSQKIAEFGVSGIHAASSLAGQNGLSTGVAYIDPNLFGTDRFFFSASVGYSDLNSHSQSQQVYFDPISFTSTNSPPRSNLSSETAALGMTIGYRLWEYSYLLSGFHYATLHSHTTTDGQSVSLSQVTDVSTDTSSWNVGYGWDSEDDAFFPTRGSRLSITGSYLLTPSSCPTCYRFYLTAAFKKTWMMGNASVWTVDIGGDPAAPADRLRPIDVGTTASQGLNLQYAHLLASDDWLGGLRRGRWYIEAGLGPVQLNTGGHIGGKPDEAHVAIGIRFESKTLGLIELQAVAARAWPRIGE